MRMDAPRRRKHAASAGDARQLPRCSPGPEGASGDDEDQARVSEKEIQCEADDKHDDGASYRAVKQADWASQDGERDRDPNLFGVDSLKTEPDGADFTRQARHARWVAARGGDWGERPGSAASAAESVLVAAGRAALITEVHWVTEQF